MADDKPTVFGQKATEQIAKTVREVARREMNPRGHRGRWQWQGGDGGIVDTAYATIAASAEHDEFQEVTLYRKAIPDTFTTETCGDKEFDDMQFTLSESMGTATVLVPAGYKAGEALLIKMEVGVTAHAWSGWVVFTGPTLRCQAVIEKDPECCPLTQLIKMTTTQAFWFFGELSAEVADPC